MSKTYDAKAISLKVNGKDLAATGTFSYNLGPAEFRYGSQAWFEAAIRRLGGRLVCQDRPEPNLMVGRIWARPRPRLDIEAWLDESIPAGISRYAGEQGVDGISLGWDLDLHTWTDHDDALHLFGSCYGSGCPIPTRPFCGHSDCATIPGMAEACAGATR